MGKKVRDFEGGDEFKIGTMRQENPQLFESELQRVTSLEEEGWGDDMEEEEEDDFMGSIWGMPSLLDDKTRLCVEYGDDYDDQFDNIVKFNVDGSREMMDGEEEEKRKKRRQQNPTQSSKNSNNQSKKTNNQEKKQRGGNKVEKRKYDRKREKNKARTKNHNRKNRSRGAKYTS